MVERVARARKKGNRAKGLVHRTGLPRLRARKVGEAMKKRLTEAKLRRIKKLLVDRPHCRLVSGVTGLVTCDGYAIEFGGGVIHPLAFLDIVDEKENEPIDILNRGRV